MTVFVSMVGGMALGGQQFEHPEVVNLGLWEVGRKRGGSPLHAELKEATENEPKNLSPPCNASQVTPPFIPSKSLAPFHAGA